MKIDRYQVYQSFADPSKWFVFRTDNLKTMFEGPFEACEKWLDENQFVAEVSGALVTKQNLSEMFAMVEDKANWKNPIKFYVGNEPPAFTKAMIEKAVEFFTGSKVEWKVNKAGGWTVTAPGYYAACGG